MISRVSDITNKWELAERLVGNTQGHELVLKKAFEGILEGLEKVTGNKFGTDLKEKVWRITSGKRLETIKETLILEFCNQILGTFTEKEAAEALLEHQKTGIIKHHIYGPLIYKEYNRRRGSITKAVVTKTEALAGEWSSNIMKILKDEGIDLQRKDQKDSSEKNEKT